MHICIYTHVHNSTELSVHTCMYQCITYSYGFAPCTTYSRNIIHKYVCTLAYSYTLAYNLHYTCTYEQVSMTMYIKTQTYTQYFGLRIQRQEMSGKKITGLPSALNPLNLPLRVCLHVCVGRGGREFIYVCKCMHAQS